MKPKYFEFDPVYLKGKKDKYLIDEVRSDGTGYFYLVEKVASEPLKIESRDRFRVPEEEIEKVCPDRLTGIIPLSSVLENEEKIFLFNRLGTDFSKVPLNFYTATNLLCIVTDGLFSNELSKKTEADDAVLSYLVRIINKLSKLTSCKTDVEAKYYNHIFERYVYEDKSDQADPKFFHDLLIKMLQCGDYSCLLPIGVFGYKYKDFTKDEAYRCFSLAADNGLAQGYYLMSLIELDRKDKVYFNPSDALSLLTIPLGEGFMPAFYLAAKIIFEYKTDIINPDYAYRLVFKAYLEQIGYFLDGYENVLVAEECFLLGKMLKSNRLGEPKRRESLMYLLIAEKIDASRSEIPPLLSFEKKSTFTGKIKRELSTFSKEEKAAFSVQKVTDPIDGFSNFVNQESNKYLIDNIEQDTSEKKVKITLTLQNNVIPAIDSQNITYIYDKIIIRIFGIKPLKNLKSHFYMGLEYSISQENALGKVFFDFTDKGGFGYFSVEGDSYTVSLNEWKGPLKPFKKGE